jgi:hypothetical protein
MTSEALMSTSTTERAQEAASTAADEGRHVAETAKDEAQNVAAEAKAQARNVLDDALTQVNEQTQVQRDRLVDTLKSLSSDLEEMATRSGAGGLATDLARQVSDRTRELSARLDGREPSDILDEVRTFARQRPGSFLLGALVAGLAVGRLARGAKAATGSSTPTMATQSPSGTGTTSPEYGVSTPGYRTQDAPGDGGLS